MYKTKPHWVCVPATRNGTRDDLMAANLYSQMLYQLSYSRLLQQLGGQD